MKFILGVIICSSVYNTCLPPHEWHEKFDNLFYFPFFAIAFITVVQGLKS